MNGHEPHRPRVLGGGPGDPPFFQPVQMVQEPLQGTQAPLLKFRCQHVKLPQIFLGPVPGRAGGINAIQIGSQEDFFQKFCQGAEPCHGSEVFQHGKKSLSLGGGVGQQGLIKRALLGCPPDLGQVVCRKAKDRACKSGDQGNILPGVGDGLQEAPQGPYFRSL